VEAAVSCAVQAEAVCCWNTNKSPGTVQATDNGHGDRKAGLDGIQRQPLGLNSAQCTSSVVARMWGEKGHKTTLI